MLSSRFLFQELFLWPQELHSVVDSLSFLHHFSSCLLKKKMLPTFCFLSYFERGCFEQKHIVISGNHIDRRFRTPVIFLVFAPPPSFTR
jgi:hypothetical protein